MRIERTFEDCSLDLSERIIKKAYDIRQKHSWLKAIASLFADFSMPNPAFVMPALFLFGLVTSLGLSTSPTDTIDFMDNLYLSL